MSLKYLPLLADDWRYLVKLTVRIPNHVVSKLVWLYKIDWIKARELEPVEHKKENAGRFYANSEIRKNVWDYMEAGKEPDCEVPRFCINCDHLHMQDGMCQKYNQAVPEDYQRKDNDCEHFLCQIPF